MAALDGVRYIRLPLPMIPLDLPQVGDYTSEGVAVMNASEWHDMGYTGAGVIVGMLDTGFNTTHEALEDLDVQEDLGEQ